MIVTTSETTLVMKIEMVLRYSRRGEQTATPGNKRHLLLSFMPSLEKRNTQYLLIQDTIKKREKKKNIKKTPIISVNIRLNHCEDISVLILHQ